MLSPQLRELAELHRVQLGYFGIGGEWVDVSPEALSATLRSLGARLETEDDVEQALLEARANRWGRALEPVMVAWNGEAVTTELRLDARAEGPVRCTLTTESGHARSWKVALADLPETDTGEVDGLHYSVRRIDLPGAIPLGYHRLVVTVGDRRWEARVIAAPERAHVAERRSWGVFLPVYALRTERDWGAGDWGDLEELIQWVGEQGGEVVATLPMLAAYLHPYLFQASPYSPATRLFWNEAYLALDRAPEWAASPEAAALWAAPATRAEVRALREMEYVDYERLDALKTPFLALLAERFFADGGDRSEAFQSWLAERPAAEDYARFRATVEAQGSSWWNWPERLRGGDLQPGDWDEAARRRHLYAQFRAHTQLEALNREARSGGGLGLYLDLPIGVNWDGYDLWRFGDVFARGANAGAPPDPFSATGQDWGFAPLHPERIRESGYEYFIACIRNHLRYAGLLRLDHVMGLRRLYWVPHGRPATDGAYVQYHADELYAILCLESHRFGAAIVGEDLGVVPPEVRESMERHEFSRMYVAQFEGQPKQPALRPVPLGAAASTGTHDTHMWRAFWEGLDIADRVELGWVDEAAARRSRAERAQLRLAVTRYLHRQGLLAGEGVPASDEALGAVLTLLGRSPARLVLATLEDLWGETRSQNTPGTWKERPNWQRKAQHTLEQTRRMPEVRDTLTRLHRARQTDKETDRE